MNNSEPLTRSSKIPVFLHIPKNAGTYVLSWCFNLIRMQGIIAKKNSQLDWNISLRLILVKKNNETIFTAVAYDPFHLENPNFSINTQNKYVSEIDFNNFLLEIDKGFIEFSSIHIESYGFKFLKTDLYKNLFSKINKNPLYFCILRDPLSRAQSMYNYILSNNSIHEETHGKIESRSFIDYIKSHEIEDSWLIRSFIGISDNDPITHEDFINTCDFLDNVRIRDISQTNSLIDNIFIECYSIGIEYLNNFLNKSIQIKNENNTTNSSIIKLFELDKELKSILVNRTKFDYKIYEKYCNA